MRIYILLRSPKSMILMSEILNICTVQFTKCYFIDDFITGPGLWVKSLSLPHGISRVDGHGIWKQTNPGSDSICTVL